MSDNTWHRSTPVLGSILATMAVIGGFSVFALDGPLRFALMGVAVVGIVLSVGRLGQVQRTARSAG
ncbi:hypothetical protein [Nocardiopsis sp. FIRDI 009]|uniref:hypothetical protein n=1 Tax=Nocardiopsis sp. FIRDI 009 TaxID=714197 RepID=UPI000E2666E4|nr:hypothetical protein [Nocardiopsis sp. FIRDI 009]